MDFEVTPAPGAARISSSAPINPRRWDGQPTVLTTSPRGVGQSQRVAGGLDGRPVHRHFRRVGLTAPGPAGAVIIDGLIPTPADLSEFGFHYVGRVPAIERFRDARLMDGLPRPEDVHQGPLKNCFDVAVLSAVAHRQPEQLSKRFSVLDPNGNVEVVTWGGHHQPHDHFWVNPEQHLYRNDAGIEIFGSAAVRDGILWPICAERALAAAHPYGYEGVNHGGDMHETAMTMERFTGRSAATVFDLTLGLRADARHISAKLSAAEAKGLPAVVSLDFAAAPSLVKQVGLNAEGHGTHLLWVEHFGDGNTVSLRDQRTPDRPAWKLHITQVLPMLMGIVVGNSGHRGAFDIEIGKRRVARMRIR